jgi:Tfp pilus assembly protein PilE
MSINFAFTALIAVAAIASILALLAFARYRSAHSQVAAVRAEVRVPKVV